MANVAQNKDVREKTVATNLERYGYESSALNDGVIKKRIETVHKKYGVAYTFAAEEIKTKIKETVKDKYGVDSYTQTEEYKEKTRSTNNSKYGENHPMQNKEFKQAVSDNVLKKYGKKWYGGSDDHKKKVKLYVDMHYDGVYPINHTDAIKKRLDNVRLNRLKYIDDVGCDIVDVSTNMWHLMNRECGHEFVLSRGSFANRLKNIETICTICNPFNIQQSNGEVALYDWVVDMFPNSIERDRQKITPYELDVFIPEKKLAIEYNGLYYHGELFDRKPTHAYKTDVCIKKGIHLTHVWEDDWQQKQGIIKSIIKTQLGLADTIIYARKCLIKDVSSKDSNVFLTDNHIQGNSTAKYKYGLYYNDELVSLMTFSQRKFLNKNEEGFELVRLCTKINTSVVGGASRLWKHFLKSVNPTRVVSYSDRGIFKGDVYRHLGFAHDHVSAPGYQWVIGGKRMHRYNFTKQKLIAAGYDGAKTEVVIMHERGAYRVYDSGQNFFVWEAPKLNPIHVSNT